MADRSIQKSGDGSSQVQVAGDLVVVQGVTEARAKEIALEVAKTALAEYTDEAREIGFQRIGAFDERLLVELIAADRLSVLKDPSFQVVLKRAQVGAASTEREADYDMLAKLLADRATRDERPIRASIGRAVEVVDQLDDQALAGLTVAMAIAQFNAVAGDPMRGLDTLDGLFEELVTAPLPAGSAWMDHLDVLDAIRLSTSGLGGLKKFGAIYATKNPGWVCEGASAERDKELQTEMLKAHDTVLTSVDHVFKPGYRRLTFPTLAVLSETMTAQGDLDDAKRDALLAVARDEYKIDSVDTSAQAAFEAEIGARSYLAIVQAWWDAIPNGMQITGVGTVLGRANAARLDRKGLLPPLA